MTIRNFVYQSDYDLMKEWFTKRNFPCPQKALLPVIGQVVLHDSIPVCMGHLYRTDASVAVISHLVNDPDQSGKVRDEALNLLIVTLLKIAAAQDYQVITFSTNLPRVADRFASFGFIKTDENLMNFGRALCQ